MDAEGAEEGGVADVDCVAVGVTCSVGAGDVGRGERIAEGGCSEETSVEEGDAGEEASTRSGISGEGGVGVPTAGVPMELAGEAISGVAEGEKLVKTGAVASAAAEDMCISVSEGGGVGGYWRGTRGAGGRVLAVGPAREAILERENSGVSVEPVELVGGIGGSGLSGFGIGYPT